MRRKDLEITLQRNVQSFENPKIELEQYQTPPRVAANLVFRAFELGDIVDKSIVDACAGTGILGIAARLMGANDITSVEVDKDLIDVMNKNFSLLDIASIAITSDIFDWEPDKIFDTALVNPPFGINRMQRKFKDMDFIRKIKEFSKVIWSIHDGSPTNQKKLPMIFQKNGLKVLEYYIDEFPLTNSYFFHTSKRKEYSVMVVRSTKISQ